MSRLPTMLAAACGLCLGWSASVVGERLRLEAGPDGWQSTWPDVPLRLARLAGPPRLPGQGWPLDSHGVLGRHLSTEARSLEVVADIPAGGQLELRLGGARPDEGVALVLSRVGEGLAEVARAGSESVAPVGPAAPRQWLDCDGWLEVPGDGPTRLGLRHEAGVIRATVGDSQVRCPDVAVGSRVALRSGLRRVGLQSLAVNDTSPQRAPRRSWPLRLLGGLVGAGLAVGLVRAAAAVGVRASIVAICLLPGLLAPLLAASDLQAALQAARIVADQPVLWGLGLPLALTLGLLTLAAQVWWVRHPVRPGARAMVTVAALAGLPCVLGFGLVGLAAVPLAVLLSMLLLTVADRIGPDPRRAVLGSMALALFAGLLAAALQPRFAVAIPLTQLGALLLGLLLWINARAAEVRFFNLLSLLLFVGIAASAEQALTWTATGMSLVGVSSRAAGPATPAAGSADDLGTAFRSFEALENTREFQRYPIQDYPVQPPPRSAAGSSAAGTSETGSSATGSSATGSSATGSSATGSSATVRIAALGSSSTAGAYQNDDIAEFWPADLDRLLGAGVQVINQGVGGWTSLHVRRYVETRPDVLDADILVIYLGHNDLLTESPRPYRDIHAAWKAGGSASTALSTLLGDLRLYQLLRFGIQGLAGVGVGPAVPLEHAADNYQALAQVQEERGGRILLVSEAMAPDPSVLEPYARMLEEVAAEHDDVAFLDAGPILSDPRRSGIFLDDCHLTRRGHELLAQTVADELRRLGWVD